MADQTLLEGIDIRPARETELDLIWEMRKRAQSFMASYGNANQWTDANPPRSYFEEDFKRGELWVACEGDEILASMSIVKGPDPNYAVIEGAWISDEPYYAIHRFIVDAPGRGLGKALLNWAYDNFGHLRIDTHEKNAPMQGAIRACGFTVCGIVWVSDGTERIAFERL